MGFLLPHAAAAKAIALVFVLAIIAMRSDRRRFHLGLCLALAATGAHGWEDGAAGLLFAAAGAALAILFTVPLLAIGGLDRHDIAFSAAAGAILGPAGAAVAFIVALFAFALRRRATTARAFPCEDRLIARYPSLFAATEANAEGVDAPDSGRMAGEPQSAPAAPPVTGISPARLFDWGRVTAIAVMAVLLLDLPL